MSIFLFTIVAAGALGLLLILIHSPGKLPPLKDGQGNVIDGSLSEKIWVEINGIKQGMFIRTENPQNPVVLYLHGGPGTPLLQFITALEKEERLEKYFTVCYWEQRGSGITYSKDTPPSSMTLEQMADDAQKVTEYLKSRFGQEKIYLIGHSWGSYLGVKTIEQSPQNYLAYIGIGQVTNQAESERFAYDYILTKAKEENNRKVLNQLTGVDPSAENFPSLDYLVKGRTALLNSYGVGQTHQGVSFGQILYSLFLFKGYTLFEKLNWFLGSVFSMAHLFIPLTKDNLFLSSAKFQVPFYIMQGDYDYMTSQVLAREYLDAIEAPKKEYFAFANSAHSPNMEEPEAFILIFRRIAAENPLG